MEGFQSVVDGSSSNSITWGLVRNENSQDQARPTESEAQYVYFNPPPQLILMCIQVWQSLD